MTGRSSRVGEVGRTDGTFSLSPQAMEHLRAAMKEKDLLLKSLEVEAGLVHLVELLRRLNAVAKAISPS